MDFSENKVKKIILTLEVAELKIKNWCAYQERSQNEVRLKLFDYRLNETESRALKDLRTASANIKLWVANMLDRKF